MIISEYISTTFAEAPHADFAIQAPAALYPLIGEGDMVMIAAQEDVEDGQIAAITYNGATALAIVHHMPDGAPCFTFALGYKPNIIGIDGDGQPIRIIGRAVSATRML